MDDMEVDDLIRSLTFEEVVQAIADVCGNLGCDFEVALRTYVRDGRPWFVKRETARVL